MSNLFHTTCRIRIVLSRVLLKVDFSFVRARTAKKATRHFLFRNISFSEYDRWFLFGGAIGIDLVVRNKGFSRWNCRRLVVGLVPCLGAWGLAGVKIYWRRTWVWCIILHYCCCWGAQLVKSAAAKAAFCRRYQVHVLGETFLFEMAADSWRRLPTLSAVQKKSFSEPPHLLAPNVRHHIVRSSGSL